MLFILFPFLFPFIAFIETSAKESFIGTSAKGLNEVVLDEKEVKRDRGNVSIPLVCASRENRVFAFLSPKEPFAEVPIFIQR